MRVKMSANEGVFFPGDTNFSTIPQYTWNTTELPTSNAYNLLRTT
jgi:hypothetical protein